MNTQAAVNINLRPGRQRSYRRACAGKMRHATIDAAWREARRLADTYGASMTAYRCAFCGCWHVGHSRPQTAQVDA